MAWPSSDEMSFGAFRVSEHDRTLRSAEGLVPLPSRAFDVLLTLIESRSEVVSKDELMRRVWGKLIVQENNLHVQIAAARRALGAQRGDIQTVPGRGYRFIGEVSPRPPPAKRSALPAKMSSLLGRQAEMACICRSLQEGRLVSLLGPPGVGKTRLAREAASVLAASPARGCRWVDIPLAAGPGAAITALADRLGLPLGPPGTLVERVSDELRDDDALVVFDGCEHVLPSLRALSRLLLAESPGIRILCSSEVPLGIDGEQVVRVAPFDIPATVQILGPNPAVRLFAERAAAADGRFALTDADLPLVLQICRDLDGLPLGIELAAAWAPLIGLEALAAACGDERSRLLEHDEGQGGSGRRTLRAGFERSVRLLPDLERRALGRLARLVGPFSLADAQGVAEGLTRSEMVCAVAGLARRSLLTLDPGFDRPRYRMLKVLRSVALQLSPPADGPTWNGEVFASAAWTDNSEPGRPEGSSWSQPASDPWQSALWV